MISAYLHLTAAKFSVTFAALCFFISMLLLQRFFRHHLIFMLTMSCRSYFHGLIVHGGFCEKTSLDGFFDQ